MQKSLQKDLLKGLGRYSLFSGGLLLILGIAGFLVPAVMSVTSVYIISFMMILGGVFWAMRILEHSPKSLIHWLKPILLLLSGTLLMRYPVIAVEALGLLLVLYLVLHAVASFSYTQQLYPQSGWGWMVINGLVSLLLASLLLVGWPQTSLSLVGLYISITLLMDGGILLIIWYNLRQQ